MYRFFFFAFIDFQPVLYHLGIPRGIYRDVYSGLLQRCLQLIPFHYFSLE